MAPRNYDSLNLHRPHPRTYVSSAYTGLSLSEDSITMEKEMQYEEAEQTVEVPWKASRQIKLITAGQCFVLFIISLDMTILTTTLPTVSKALDASATASFWIAASYLLASAVCQPVIAGLADIFGRRSMFFGGVLFFTIGSIVCSTTNNIAGMLAGRTIQGVGGGGILSVNLIILSDLIPLRQRSHFQGIIQLVFGLGTCVAPIIGGALIKATWRWLFYINLPFCAIGLALIPFLLRYERPKTTVYDKLSSIDWVGSALCMASTTSFLIGISWGGNQYSWTSAATLAPIFFGIAGVAGTILYERYLATIPFLRLSLFKTWSAVAAYICTVLQGFLLFGMSYYVVIYLLACRLKSPVIAGTIMLPLSLTVVPISGVTGALIARFGSYRWAVWAGWTMAILGLGLLFLLDLDTAPAAWVFIFICAGASQGILLIANSVAVQAASDTRDVAYASSMYGFCRSFGLCLGVIVGGTIFQNLLRQRLVHLGLDAAIATSAEGFVPVLRAMSDAEPAKMAIRHAYAWALQRLFATLCGISALGFVISFAIGHHSLDKALDSKHVLKERSKGVGRGGAEEEAMTVDE